MSSDQVTEEEKISTPTSNAQTKEETPNSRKSIRNAFLEWDQFQDSKIQVELGKPVLKEDIFSKYYIYKIQGTDAKGIFDTSRRYSDFEKIRHFLVIQWPGCFVPSIPPKILNNTDQEALDERAKFLSIFCQKIAELPYLHYSDVYQTFLRTRMIDLDPVLKQYEKVRYSDIIQRYTVVFGHLSENQPNSEAISKITKFSQFLTKVSGLFEKYHKIGKRFIAAYKDYPKRLVEMHNMMADGYEEHALSEYHGNKPDKNIFNDASNSKIKENIDKMDAIKKQPAVELLYEFIQQEGRDIEAFKEAFQQREKYEKLKSRSEKRQGEYTNNFHKLVSGKSIFSSISSDKSNEKLETKISQGSKDVEDLMTLQDMITIILAYYEIEKFKSSRLQRYSEVLGIVSRDESKSLTISADYYEALLQNSNIKSL